MSSVEALRPRLDRIQFIALVAGAAGSAVGLVLGLVWPGLFFPAYMVAYLFAFGLGAGGVALLMLHRLVGGNWGRVIRRPLEASAATLPALAVLFVPIILGMESLYPWTRPEVLEHDPIVAHKVPYLNTPFWLGRAAFIFGLWSLFAFLLIRWGAERDRVDDDPAARDRVKRKLGLLSGPGLALYVLTASIAAIDWVMSIDAEWYSTIFGPILIVGQGLSTFAFTIVVSVLMAGDPPAPDEPQGHHEESPAAWYNDLGNLLLAFVMLWAYMAFSQFLIIWNGNTVEEVPYYLARTQGGWQFVAGVLVLFHFFLPFFVLLVHQVKRRARTLIWVAAGILAMRVVDLTWTILPSFPPGSESHAAGIAWGSVAMVPVALAAVGGLWGAAFVAALKRLPLDLLGEVQAYEAAHGEGSH